MVPSCAVCLAACRTRLQQPRWSIAKPNTTAVGGTGGAPLKRERPSKTWNNPAPEGACYHKGSAFQELAYGTQVSLHASRMTSLYMRTFQASHLAPAVCPGCSNVVQCARH